VIGLTTGRQTNQRLNSLLKELSQAIPGGKVVRRGKSSLEDLDRRFCDEELDYGIILQRWHGGPGRIDFLRAEAKGLTPIAPSVLLKAVKLRSEYAHQGNHAAQAITCDSRTSQTTRRFAQQLSMILDLPQSTIPADFGVKSSIHLSESRDGSILLTVTCPPGQEDVGPRLLVSRLIWDLHE
jgi:rRNA maturation protein Rpf1